MFPSLVPPGKQVQRRGTPSLPTLAIPGLVKRPSSTDESSTRGTTAILTAPTDSASSATKSASESFSADVRRVLLSDATSDRTSSTLTQQSLTPPATTPNTATAPATDTTTAITGTSTGAGARTALSSTVLDQLHEEDWARAFECGEIERLGRLGEGSSGSVYKCRLTKLPHETFALKTIPANPDVVIQRQILRELSFNRSFESPYIAQYYGAYMDDREGVIGIAMEYCEGGSLDALYKRVKQRGGRVGERVIGRVAKSVLEGLSYLHGRKIIHRDVKPSNILLTQSGHVRLCDFGVSGELVNSLAGTYTGTSYYMAPERIQGDHYTVNSDVWSLGLTLMEVCVNRFPFLDNDESPLMPIELLNVIVTQEPPVLMDEVEAGVKWSNSFRHFLKCCLERDRLKRPGPSQMLEHPWIIGISEKRVDMVRWITEVWR